MCRARRSWRRRAEWRGRQGDAQATVRRAPACPFCLTIALLWETKGGWRWAHSSSLREDTDPEQNFAKDRESEHRVGGREGKRWPRRTPRRQRQCGRWHPSAAAAAVPVMRPPTRGVSTILP
jgi:hypothetical protein